MHVGIEAIREISEVENRRKDTEHSYTFHGRDVYAYTGAKLASGHISFEEVGPKLKIEDIVEIQVVETTLADTYVRPSPTNGSPTMRGALSAALSCTSSPTLPAAK